MIDNPRRTVYFLYIYDYDCDIYIDLFAYFCLYYLYAYIDCFVKKLMKIIITINNYKSYIILIKNN